MKLKKVLSICKTNGLYYLYDRIDRSGEITQWLGDGYALYPLDGLPILDEESFCAVFDITGKQREKILFRHERLPEHLNVARTWRRATNWFGSTKRPLSMAGCA